VNVEIGQTLAHYTVTARVGAGGMGEVYRATDTKLGRDVALKVLPAKTASDQSRLERFQREARALAALNHPHIVTIYSVEEADGVHFLTMELVEGQALSQLMRAGALPVERLLAIASAIAEALAAAHEKGIVHRDLKPANVMVADSGRVKVLDFGLAKLADQASDEGLNSQLPTALETAEGVVMGTMPYMSPEQVEGRAVDHRSDIFSMGVLLYEMATGRRPFQADNTAGLISAILRDEPPAPTAVRRDLPDALRRLIEGCLRKDPARRFQSAREARAALQPQVGAVKAAGGGHESTPSIAVLPFVNMSADRENDYFSDGLSEEIINALTRLPDLRVIARTSAFRFRGEQDLRRVGEALGVRTVLEGSVRKAGQQLRITAQLIDVADDSHIWSERFDRELVDVFEIQDEISAAIVKKLHLSLGAGEPARRDRANVAAFEALLEGRHHFSQFTPKSAERALVCLQRALSLEPDYPDALAMHAFYHLMLAYMFANPREALPSTRALAERALQLDPHHGEAQAAVAVVAVMLDRDWSGAELLFRRALVLAPASAIAHELYGLVGLLGRGRLAEALAELDRAIELDPLSALYAGNRGRVLTCSRRFAEAEESCRRGLALDPGQLLVQVELIYALLFQGKFEEAIAVGKRAIETHGPANAPRQALALSYALAGQRDAALQLVKETTEPGAGYRSPLALGLVHAALSEMDEAFACVERSVEERDPLLMYLAVHPMFDPLRSDPRFPDLLRRMNLSGDEDPTGSELRAPVEAISRVERHTVGRQSELDALRAALEAARGGRGSLVCVAGEPGIGKTTLVEAFLTDAAKDGSCAVARGRCSERLAGSDAYLPVLEALDSLLHGSDGVAAARAMKQVAPVWYAQVAPPSGRNDESAEQVAEIKDATQERLKRDFAAYVEEVSRSRPLIVFLDDLHWADVSTIDLLSFLAGKFEGSNVLVVVTYRPSDMLLSKHSFLQIKPDLQTRGLCRELVLEFLHESEIADYLALEFRGHGFPPEFTTLIHGKTEGSPLFMADLVRYLRDDGAIGKVDGQWKLVHGLPEIQRELPESVRGMIERKIG